MIRIPYFLKGAHDTLFFPGLAITELQIGKLKLNWQ
jgi:hypothetical protein